MLVKANQNLAGLNSNEAPIDALLYERFPARRDYLYSRVALLEDREFRVWLRSPLTHTKRVSRWLGKVSSLLWCARGPTLWLDTHSSSGQPHFYLNTAHLRPLSLR